MLLTLRQICFWGERLSFPLWMWLASLEQKRRQHLRLWSWASHCSLLASDLQDSHEFSSRIDQLSVCKGAYFAEPWLSINIRSAQIKTIICKILHLKIRITLGYLILIFQDWEISMFSITEKFKWNYVSWAHFQFSAISLREMDNSQCPRRAISSVAGHEKEKGPGLLGLP